MPLHASGFFVSGGGHNELGEGHSPGVRELVAARAAFVAVGVDAPPSVLRDAREALVTVYTETGRSGEAERMRREMKDAGAIAAR